MIKLPEKIKTEEQLEEMLSRPSPETIELFSRLQGDILILGIGGKIGPSLARMAKRACEEAGVKKTIFGVSRFHDCKERDYINRSGILTIQGDLLDPYLLENMPDAANVFFLAGMKFGAEDNPSFTWAMNSYLPGLIAERYKKSRIVAYSTGCVYPLVPVSSGGSLESDKPDPVGEYAQSCLGRERIFEYGSIKNGTPLMLIRLNYAVELRYGVLVDIALKVRNREPVNLSMGHFNTIWQGDANNMILRAIEKASSPASILNITGEDVLAVRQIAADFGKLFGIKPVFEGRESPTAFLNNSGRAFESYGRPETPVGQIIRWIAGWIDSENRILGKPTHYEIRNGKY